MRSRISESLPAVPTPSETGHRTAPACSLSSYGSPSRCRTQPTVTHLSRGNLGEADAHSPAATKTPGAGDREHVTFFPIYHSLSNCLSFHFHTQQLRINSSGGLLFPGDPRAPGLRVLMGRGMLEGPTPQQDQELPSHQPAPPLPAPQPPSLSPVRELPLLCLSHWALPHRYCDKNKKPPSSGQSSGFLNVYDHFSTDENMEGKTFTFLYMDYLIKLQLALPI